jgi:homoserine dehydrogenase
MNNSHRLCLVGFGNVGRAFAQLLLTKEAELADRYGVTVSVTGIITGSHSAAINPGGIDLAAAWRV